MSVSAPPRPPVDRPLIDGLPPGPGGPATLHLLGQLLRPGPYMRRCQERYGDLFAFPVPLFERLVITCDAEHTRRIFLAGTDTMEFGAGAEFTRILGPNSLLSLEGDEHLRERRLLLPSFKGDRVQAYRAVIEEEAARELARWPVGEEFPVRASMQTITLRIILRAVFGAAGESLRTLERLLPRWTVPAFLFAQLPVVRHDLGRLSPWGHVVHLRRQIDAELDRLADEARRDPRLEERADVLATLVRTRREDGAPLTDREIGDHLMTMLVAGHETTALTLSWIVERLRRERVALAEVTEEARAGGHVVREAMVKEVMRVRPVTLHAGRTALRPFEVGDYRLPAGTSIVASVQRLHADERVFPGAHRFDPHRFLRERISTYSWLPFGGGGRRCLGATLALLEAEIVTRVLLERFDLVPTADPGERMRCRGTTYGPARGGRAVVRRRG